MAHFHTTRINFLCYYYYYYYYLLILYTFFCVSIRVVSLLDLDFESLALKTHDFIISDRICRGSVAYRRRDRSRDV